MKIIVYLALFVFSIWLVKHPNTKALMIGVKSAFVDAPIEQAKSDFRKEAEKQAQKEAEARMKKIDTVIDAADRGVSSDE